MGDFDRLVGLDVPRERIEVRLDAAAAQVELPSAPLVVANHELQEEPVEALAAGAAKLLQLRLGRHTNADVVFMQGMIGRECPRRLTRGPPGWTMFLGGSPSGSPSPLLQPVKATSTRATSSPNLFRSVTPTFTTTEPSFAVARSYVDQLVRADDIDAKTLDQVTKFLDGAERFQSGPQGEAAKATLRALANQLKEAKYDALRETLEALGSR